MWKSNVKNVFSYQFPCWSDVLLIAQSLTCLPGRLINNKNRSPIRCFDQVFLKSMVFYVNIWTGIASNNTNSWSATYDSTEYWPISPVNTALHRKFISKPRWAMSIFLLKSDGGKPQNMRFNVFVICVCSIYGENNIWHAKSWRFTLAVEVASQTALYHDGSLASLI